MKEHPLPQDITGYRFHIVGNMTLKQFALVAGGCVVGFFIYLTNLPAFVSWPLILLSAGAGAFMAFIPFEERPFDHWVFTFFKVIYNPTQYYWERKPKLPPAFMFEPNQDTKQSMLLPELDLSPARRTRVKEYLRSVHQAPEQETDEFYRADTLQNVMDAFYGRAPSTVQQPVQVEAPVADVASAAVEAEVVPIAGIEAAAYAELGQSPPPAGEVSGMPAFEAAAPIPVPADVVFPAADPAMGGTILWQQGGEQAQQQSPAAPTAEGFATQPQFDPVQVPNQEFIDIQAQPTDDTRQDAASADQVQPPQPVFVTNTAPAAQDQAVSAVQFNANLTIPNLPTQPNKLVGVVTDGTLPIPYAIVEVLNPDGLTARAVKTNAFGQFFVSTPLGNGSYLIRAEKEGLAFPTQQLELNGNIVPPIEITAQSQVQ